jgi:hypothetical protein
VFYSKEGSFNGLGGLTFMVDLNDPNYVEIIKSMGYENNRYFTEQTVSMVGDLMMFNDEDKIFTFVYFEVRVSPSGMVTHRFVEIEPYA